eukprot:3357558-Ditylum_brightwellii.AAC.1
MTVGLLPFGREKYSLKVIDDSTGGKSKKPSDVAASAVPTLPTGHIIFYNLPQMIYADDVVSCMVFLFAGGLLVPD